MELRPLEKTVERLMARGESSRTIANRFNKTERWSLQVAKLIDYKRGNMELPQQRTNG